MKSSIPHHGLNQAVSPVDDYSLCSTTVRPIKPSITVFNQGYSLNKIVT